VFSGGGGRLVWSPRPSSRHLHDNAVGVLGLGLGDLDGGSDGRHVDGFGFVGSVNVQKSV